MMVTLIDISDPKNLTSIDEYLIEKKCATRGDVVCKKNNITFEHYQLCKYKQSGKLCATNSLKNLPSVSNSTTNSNIGSEKVTSDLCTPSSSKKLESFKKYTARLSGSSTSSNS